MQGNWITDEEILYLVRQGSEWAYDLFAERYKREAYLIAASLTRRAGCGEVEEAAEAALVGMYRAIGSYREDAGAKFHTYAEKVAEHEVRDVLRYERSRGFGGPRRVLSLDMPVSEESSVYLAEAVACPDRSYEPEFAWRQRELEQRCKKLVDSLEKEERTVFELWREDRPYKEIAARLGCSVKHVDAVLQKVKKRVRACVDERY